MDAATNELKYRTSDTNYVTQRIVWDNEVATRTDLYVSNQLGQQWRFLTGVQWEPNTEERVNQVVQIEYESCCWRVAVVHAYERDKATSTDGGHSMWKLQLALKGLGVLGRGASSIMERLLEGYELSELDIKCTLSTLVFSGLLGVAEARVIDKIVVAVVDSGVVLSSDIKTRLNDLHTQAESQNNTIEMTDELRQQVLERLILEQAQVEVAKRRGLQIDDARVNETLLQIAKNRDTDLLGLKMRSRLIGRASLFFEQIRRELLISAVRDREVRSRIRISDSELERFMETTGGQISTA